MKKPGNSCGICEHPTPDTDIAFTTGCNMGNCGWHCNFLCASSCVFASLVPFTGNQSVVLRSEQVSMTSQTWWIDAMSRDYHTNKEEEEAGSELVGNGS
jgi:hypothetical protein